MAEMIERVTRLETTVERHDRDINSLRETRHNHGNEIQRVILQAASINAEMKDLQEDVIPEMAKTMRELAEEIRDIRMMLAENKSDHGLVKRVASYAFGVIQMIATGWVLYLLTGAAQ